MKVRQGFVSNSSSSSFVLKTNKTSDQIYYDIQEFFEKYSEYKNFLNGKESYLQPTLEEIKENVSILRGDEYGNIDDLFVKNWYIEDHEHSDDFFKFTTVVYGNENFLPAELEDYFWSRHIYTQEYEYLDSCTHMG